MIDSLQNLASFFSTLSIVPKLVLSFLLLNLCFFALVLLWYRAPTTPPWETPVVITAYERMVRVLNELPDTLDAISEDMYHPYKNILKHIEQHPNDIPGAYEAVWSNGAGSRVYTSDTLRFNTVVGEFFEVYRTAEKSSVGQ